MTLRRLATTRLADRWLALAVGLGAFALYLRTMPPTVLDGDSGEFQYMAYILGVPHASGYPLYVLLGKLFTFLPFGDVAFRVNLLSVVTTALAVAIVYVLLRRVTISRPVAFITTSFFAVMPSIWGSALETKVYGLHLLIGVLAIFLMLRWHQEHCARDLYAAALVFGLGLTNHLVIAFSAPAFALVLWFNRAYLTRAMVARAAIVLVLPLTLYAYIPIRANYWIAQQDPQNWELYPRADAMLKGTVTAYYNNTVQGFFELITGLGYSYKFGFESPVEESNRLNNALRLLWQQFGVGLVFVVAGALIAFVREHKVFAMFAALALGVGFIAVYLRAAHSTIYYFSLFYLALAVWFAFGADALLRYAARAPRLVPALVTLGLVAFPAAWLVTNFARLDESQNYAARDYAQIVLNDDLAPNAVVIAPWEISQPLRYFQFVENQRPDLLITNISPIWPQFERVMMRARELKRPFYNVEFYPESRNAPGPRSVQAVPLPLPTEPQPRYALHDARIVPEVQVLGYEVRPDPPQPGVPTRVLVYYRTLARMYPMYSAMLSIHDATGKLIGDYEGFPGSYYFPTYRWRDGEMYRSAWTIHLPADAPAGLYHLDLFWYVYDLDARVSDYTREFHVALGTIRVGEFGVAHIEHPHNARFGDAITFLGWNGAREIARGQTLPLDLIWRAERVVDEAYTVFVHLVDAQGRVARDADSPPFSGLYPTNRWQVGEVLRDRHILQIPRDLAPGDYTIEIGMYLPTTNARVVVEGGADKIVLTTLWVK